MCPYSSVCLPPQHKEHISTQQQEWAERKGMEENGRGEKQWGMGGGFLLQPWKDIRPRVQAGFVFFCFFVDRPMWGFTIPSQIAWIQSALSLLSPPWPGIHSPWLDASLLLGARVSWEMNLELDKTLSRDEVLWHQQMIFEESPLHSKFWTAFFLA